MFTRHEVCMLTGIPVERFKSLVRRNQLATINVPTLGASDRSRDLAKERGWNQFSAMDVFMIAVQERFSCQIGYADGLSSETAAKIVSNNAGSLRDVFLDSTGFYIEGQLEKWIGYAGSSATGDPDINNGGRNISGTLTEVVEALHRDTDRPVRLFLVNADAVLKEVSVRAMRHFNIDFIVSGKTEIMDSARA